MKYLIALACAFLLLSTAAMAGPADDALMRAIHAGDAIKAQQALREGARVNQPLPDGSVPLAWAADAQNPELVQLLLASGAKPDVDTIAGQNFSPLIAACQRGDPAIVTALLDVGADVNRTAPSGISPLALCAGNSSASVVQRLLEMGAAVDAADENGQTPLMWAAAKGQIEVMPVLLNAGADINRTTEQGFTPLFFAIKSGDPRAPVAMMEAGGDIHYRTPDGTSAVQLAMYQKQFAFAELLIKRGVDLTAYDRNGHQLLHAAVLNQQPALVALLLEKGADPNALTGTSQVVWRYEVNFTSRPYLTHAKSPLLLATELGSTEMMNALIAAGADKTFRLEDDAH